MASGASQPSASGFYAAQGIREDSWLNDDTISDDFVAFRQGYAYARNMTRAIPGLSKITAEEAYYVWWGINHGIDLAAPPSANAPSTSGETRD